MVTVSIERIVANGEILDQENPSIPVDASVDAGGNLDIAPPDGHVRIALDDFRPSPSSSAWGVSVVVLQDGKRFVFSGIPELRNIGANWDNGVPETPVELQIPFEDKVIDRIRGGKATMRVSVEGNIAVTEKEVTITGVPGPEDISYDLKDVSLTDSEIQVKFGAKNPLPSGKQVEIGITARKHSTSQLIAARTFTHPLSGTLNFPTPNETEFTKTLPLGTIRLDQVSALEADKVDVCVGSVRVGGERIPPDSKNGIRLTQ